MTRLGPKSLTRDEQRAILEATADQPRENAVVSLALGTGLRLGEIVGLIVADVFGADGRVRTRIHVRREIAKRNTSGDIFVPDALLPKLSRFREHKIARNESLDPGAPLICSSGGRRISTRRVQVLFREAQVRAGLDHLYGFHALRHSAVTAVYRASRDLFLAQRFARHASPLTTTIYTHPSDEELRAQVRHLVC